MNRYIDSLEVVLNYLNQREQDLAEERTRLIKQLARLEVEYNHNLGRIDKLWEAGEINAQLDTLFPSWKGQFWAATRSDGIHGIIVPRMFGAEVAEIKTEFDKNEDKMEIKEKEIANYQETMGVKDEKIETIAQQRDSIKTTYDDLMGEYKDLNDKYNKEVKSRWFKLIPGNALSAGVGLGAGYFIGKAVGKD